MTARERRALVVVGGGLAGLAATAEAARTGLATCLIEQRSSLRGPRELLDEVRASGAETRLHSAVWGIWGHELAVTGPDESSMVIAADQIVLATGAYERPVAFPGWTLPGVMSAGGALRLLEHGVAPGARVLVAGYGTYVESAASTLRAGGVIVVDVADASAGRIVVRAEGDATLTRALVSVCDGDWRPRLGTEQPIDIDALVLAFGYLPENQLARLAGCEHEDSEFVSPRTVRDAWMRTSVPGVLVAGDAGGIVGPEAACAQGRLAGRTAALDAGLPADQTAGSAMPTTDQRPRAGLYALADARTVVCRCEDVTAEHITRRMFEGSLEPGPIIAESRAAMGSCQGRNCASQIAAVLARHAGQPIERIPSITPRPPVVPVSLGAIAERPPAFEG
jgi:NADPH-dependent 2,4-dienoyl-CoA reductase/sulfur reductase-like enzyme